MKLRNAYSVIELLIVITAISLIMGISYQGVNILLNNIKAAQLSSQLKQIQVGLEKYYADTGTYPTKLSLLLEKDVELSDDSDTSTATAYDAVSTAYYGNTGGDPIVYNYWAGPYLEGMERQGDCIKSKVGYEICLGAVYTSDGSITQLYKTSWSSDDGDNVSVKQDDSSNDFYHVLSVNGIESEMAIKLFENLNGRAIDVIPSSASEEDESLTTTTYNRDNIIDNKDVIGVGSSTYHQQTKTIVYRYTEAF